MGGEDAEVPAEVSHALDEDQVANTVVLAVIGMCVGAFLRFLETQIVPLIRIRLPWFALPPYTLSVFLVGSAASAIYDVEARRILAGGMPSSAMGEESVLAAIASAQIIDPHIILLVFLPPLIYESSSSMNYHTFRRVRWQALVLAFPGVVLQTFLAAAAMRYLAGYGPADEGGLWDWNVALTFGAIVCATDPVAVVSTLHAIGAPEKLADIIDGEAMLNDGSAMVIFYIFLYNVTAAARGLAPYSLATGIAFFVRLSLGGMALGMATFLVVVTWLTFVENDFRVEVAVLVIAIYGCFALAELGAGVSGVLAVVTFGLLMSRRGQYTFSPHASAVAEAVVPMLAFVSETLVFFIGGIAAWTALSSHADEIAWWHAFPLYLGLMLIRALATALLFPFLARTGYRVTVGESCVIVYAGLRGAVGLALSLIVVRTADFPALDKERIHFLVGSVVVLTMAINGTSTQALYDWLNLYPASKFRDVLVHEALAKLEGAAMADIRRELLQNSELHLYNLADWQIVRGMVPCFEGARVTEHDRLCLPDSARIDPLTTAIVRRIATSVPRFAQEEHAARGEAPEAAADDDMAAAGTRAGSGGEPPARVSASASAVEPPRGATAEQHAAEAVEASAAAAPSAADLSTEPPSPTAPRRQRSHTVDEVSRGARAHEQPPPIGASPFFFGIHEAADGSGTPVQTPRRGSMLGRASDPRQVWRSEAAAHRRAQLREENGAGAQQRRSEALPQAHAQPRVGIARASSSGPGQWRERVAGRNGHQRGGGGPERGGSEPPPAALPPWQSGPAADGRAAQGNNIGLGGARRQPGASKAHAEEGAPGSGMAAGSGSVHGMPARAYASLPSASSATSTTSATSAHGPEAASTAHGSPFSADGAPATSSNQGEAQEEAHAVRSRGNVHGGANDDGGTSAEAVWRAAHASASWARRARALSHECSVQEKKTETVSALFAVLRKLYLEQYEAKQLDGTALAVCMEGLSSGEEYLGDHPLASATAAFGLELDVLLYELPEPSPAWLPYLLRLPTLGRALWRNALFRRTYVVTEALAAFVHAHDELSRVCAADSRKMALIRDSVHPAVARAKKKLREHRLRYWSLTTLQINLLTARAANALKRKHVRALEAAGDLTRADADQLAGAIDSALYQIDTIRHSAIAPRRFHRKLKLVLRQLDLGGGRLSNAKPSVSASEARENERIAAAAQHEPAARGEADPLEERATPALAPNRSALNHNHHEHNSHVHFAGQQQQGDESEGS